MFFPYYRSRRIRQNSILRSMTQETFLLVKDLVYPVFIVNGISVEDPIKGMPNQYRLSIDKLIVLGKQAFDLGIRALMLFGIPSKKDNIGTRAYAKDGIVQRAIKELKNNIPELCIITDVCLCQYTNHGHCGLLTNGIIDNDRTLDIIAKIAFSHAEAGADMIAPSGMIDGHVLKIREVLDKNNLLHIPIMSYSAKYSSQYYGPFREAAYSQPYYGSRDGYQINPGNIREAIREVMIDIDEGTDIVMIKPALAYLDVINEVRRITNIPIASFNVSGEYSMIKAADEMGWIDGKKVMMETLLSIKRSGSDIILTYFAIEAARIING